MTLNYNINKRVDLAMLKLIIFPVIFFFLNTTPFPDVSESNETKPDSTKEIYLIKQAWHTAIVINSKDLEKRFLKELKIEDTATLVDFGWGDAEFYQHPDFDYDLAFYALFYKTSSTLRVESIMISKRVYFDISEVVVKISVTDDQLSKISEYISNTLSRDKNGNPEILSERAFGAIKFYKANGDYHLFNTCNTWIANCLVKAGFKTDHNIILTGQLFTEAASIGQVLKTTE